MKIAKLWYVLCLCVFFTNTIVTAQPTEAEMLKMQQEIDAEITKFVNSLPPDEQAKFHKDVEELTKVMENMSEDELIQFLDQVLPPEQPMPMPAIEPIKPVTPEKKPAEKPKPAKPAKAEKPKKQVDEAVALIDALIAHTESFLRKSAIIPELPGKISRWIDNEKLQEVPEDVTWAELKKQIETFNQRIHTLKETDPKTGKYRYLDDLISNEPLYNNLAMMRTKLDTQEQKVEAPAFGLGSVSKSSRKAIRKVMDTYAEAIYVLAIPQELLKIIALYDPRAKELQEEVESEQKRAFEESKKGRSAAPKTEGGYGYEPSVSSSKQRPYGGGGGYDSYQPYSPVPYSGSYDDEEDFGASMKQPKEKRDGGAKKPTPPSSAKPDEKKRDESVDRVLNDTLSNLDDIDDIISDNPHFKDLSTYMAQSTPIDKAGEDLAANAFPKIQRKIKETSDKVRAFNRRVKGLPKAQQAGYTKELKGKTKESLKVLNKLERDLNSVIAKGSTMSADKRYAYLGENARNEAVKKAVPQSVNIKDIVDAINSLQKLLAGDEKKNN